MPENCQQKFPIDPKLGDLLKRQEQTFIEKFGRLPGPDDPVFFDPTADTPQPINDEVVDQLLLEAMHKAGVHPAVIHAYQETGLLVTKDNRKSLSKTDRKAWDDAIDEWYETHEE